MAVPKQTETEARSKQSIRVVFKRIWQVLKEAYPDKDPDAYCGDEDWAHGVAVLCISIIYEPSQIQKLEPNHINFNVLQTEAQTKQSIRVVFKRIRQILKEAYPDKDPDAFIDADWGNKSDWEKGRAFFVTAILYDPEKLRKERAHYFVMTCDIKSIETLVKV